MEQVCKGFHLKGCLVGLTNRHQEVETQETVSEMDRMAEEDNLHIVVERLHQVLVQVYAPPVDRIHVFAVKHAGNIRASAQQIIQEEMDLH